MEKRYAVIGDPIAHSLSPVMHNRLFEYYKIAASYERILIKPDQLVGAIEQLRNDNISGFNVTVPHKSAILPLLDEVDPLAEAIGAVNTVLNRDGKLIGYNTDGLGYVRGLQEVEPNLQSKKVLIIGAGGAARAIYFTLGQIGVEQLDLVNRTAEKATELISSCPYKINSTVFSLEEAASNLNNYDIIIQTTSIGMTPNIDESPLEVFKLRSNVIVSDIIYNPFETKFLKEAKQAGATIQNGLPMFIYQGALAFEKWTGIFPDTSLMEESIVTQLK